MEINLRFANVLRAFRIKESLLNWFNEMKIFLTLT